MDHANDTLGTLSRNANCDSGRAREGDQALGAQNSSGANAACMAVSDDAALAAIQFTKLAAELRRVVPMFPHQARTRARTLAHLRSVLRAQKRKGHGGLWSYDYARHCGLIRLFDKMHAAAKRCEVA